MATSWNKKERENKKRQERKQKEEKKQLRKEQNAGGKDLSDMLAYLDENGNLTSTPPDPTKKVEFKAEDILTSTPKYEDRDEEPPFRIGTIVKFNSEKGFGFIEDADTREQIFVHQSSADEQLKVGLRVQFETEKSPKGLRGINVVRVK
ncbi:MAG: cold shock domain-containing protein [Filimonas sp.]|nr:cold shock domain-containing protein [Filimonas sp.]